MGAVPALVVFDCDGVLSVARSSWSLVHHTYGSDNRQDLSEFFGGVIDVHEFIRRDVTRWQALQPGLTPARLQQDVLPRMAPMQGAAALVSGLLDAGAAVACVSGGLDLLVRPFVEGLGIDSALTFANGLGTDASGALDGSGLVRVPPHRKDRIVHQLMDQLDLDGDDVAAIGDTHDDAAMFLPSVRGIAFNSTDARLRAAAHHVEDRPDLRLLAPLLGLPPLGAAP